MQTKRKTQAERTAASDSAMFKAAVKLIAKEGPSQMTLAKVANEAGFTPGLIIYRFGSKAGLLKAVSEKIVELWRDKIFASIDEDSLEVENLFNMSDLYLDAVEQKSDLILAFFRMHSESYSSYEDLRHYYQKYDDLLRVYAQRVLSHAQSKGNLSENVDIKTFSVAYLAVLRGIAMQSFIDKDAVDIEAAKKTLRALFQDLLS